MSHKRSDITTLIVRIIVGGVFIFAGWMKVSNMAGTIGFFGTLGIPAFLAYIVSYAELLGGILIVLGMWTCIASSVLVVIMLGAMWFTRAAGVQGLLYPLVTLAGLVSLMGSCGGKYSVKKCDCCEVKADAPKM